MRDKAARQKLLSPTGEAVSASRERASLYFFSSVNRRSRKRFRLQSKDFLKHLISSATTMRILLKKILFLFHRVELILHHPKFFSSRQLLPPFGLKISTLLFQS